MTKITGNYSGILSARRANSISDEKWSLYLSDPDFAAWVETQARQSTDLIAVKNPAMPYPGSKSLPDIAPGDLPEDPDV